ncbi:hypothetical protein B0H11DRAFT_2160964 [Mycena galericulata]|nr:hypothetical protein B0H11DRAFT_2160964 [Mycena galericulata]
MIPYGIGYKTCQDCRDSAKLRATNKKRKNEEGDGSNASKHARPEAAIPCPTSDGEHFDEGGDEEEEMDDVSFQFIFFEKGKHVTFHGSYTIASDPMVTDKRRVQMMAYEVWKVTGYRFRVKENKTSKNGFLTRMWCSQDQARKQKSRPSDRAGAKHHDTLGMKCYPCESGMRIACMGTNGQKTVRIRLNHHDSHVHYYDVTMPAAAVAIIRENLEWTMPNSMVGKVQEKFPQVMSGQIHRAWTEMSEMLWKRDSLQLPSAQTLLEEYGDEVEVLDVHPAEGVEQLAWVMKKIAEPLRGKVVEIGLNATYNTNSKHLELYTVLGEHDNAGFPLSYSWAEQLRDKYGVIPHFVHVDKDMAEIGMIRDVWLAKIQLCWWHLREAVHTRLKNAKLSTTPYNLGRAHREFAFIDVSFKPAGCADPKELEGGEYNHDAGRSAAAEGRVADLNTLFIRIPPATCDDSNKNLSARQNSNGFHAI